MTSKLTAKVDTRPDWQWLGRSLANYILMHPKATGAKTLTQARKMAFGYKKGNTK